jgi:hypothetical protein
MNDAMEYLISRTGKAISLLGKRRTFLKQRAAEFYSEEIDLNRGDIEFIANDHSEEAKKFMLDFIEAGCFIVSRTTCKDSTVMALFQKCVKDLVVILSKTPVNPQEVAEVVCEITCMSDFSNEDNGEGGCGYCFNNDAISTFKELLSKDDGFDRLKDKLTERLNKTEKRKHELICRIKRALNKIKKLP